MLNVEYKVKCTTEEELCQIYEERARIEAQAYAEQARNSEDNMQKIQEARLRSQADDLQREIIQQKER